MPLLTLLFILLILIVLSGFFSGSEIGMMSLNRYRLRHAVRKGRTKALRVQKLLKRPDRLLGIILIGNTFANILASAIATVIAVELFGDIGVMISTILLTLIILIFSEMTPKTVAAMYPERFAYACALPLQVLQWIFAPFVTLTSAISNQLLKLFGISPRSIKAEQLNRDELRTMVHESGVLIPTEHKAMLVNILDLETVTVEDVMVPKSEIIGIDLEDDWNTILEQLETSQHTRLPLFNHTMDKAKGIIHLRKILNVFAGEALTRQALLAQMEAVSVVPETSLLTTQLAHFRDNKQRLSLVVNEYGDITGLITLEDILEEVIGEFTTDMHGTSRDISPQEDGSIVVDGSITLRELNRHMDWNLPLDGPKTLSGLIVEHLESIPQPGVSIRIFDIAIEVLQVKENKVKSAKVYLIAPA